MHQTNRGRSFIMVDSVFRVLWYSWCSLVVAGDELAEDEARNIASIMTIGNITRRVLIWIVSEKFN